MDRTPKLEKSLYFFSNKEESFFFSLIWNIISVSRLLSIEWGISLYFAVKISLKNWPRKFWKTFFWQKCSFLHIKHGTTLFFHNGSYFFLILALTYMSCCKVDLDLDIFWIKKCWLWYQVFSSPHRAFFSKNNWKIGCRNKW